MPDGSASPERHALYNPEAEQALLGALLLNNEIAGRLVGLEEQHFYDPVHARIYALAMRLIGEGRTASAVSLRPHLANDEGLAALGGIDYLARLAGAAISIVAAPAYAEDIIDLACRREALHALEQAGTRIAGMKDLGEALGAMEGALDAVQGERRQDNGASLSDAMDAAIHDMNEAYQAGEPVGISLGIPDLEAVIGKAREGDYLLLAGRPSMGKSAIAVEMSRRTALSGTGVVYWCHEMVPSENAIRMLSAAMRERGINLPYRDARAGRMSEAEFRALVETARGMAGLPVQFIDSSIRRPTRLGHEIRRHVRRMQRDGRRVLVVLDYLQKIDPDGRSPYERVSAASAWVKALAMELGLTVLVLSQLSRERAQQSRPDLLIPPAGWS